MTYEPKKPVDKPFEPIDKIPASPNSIENGFDDPEPEKGPQGSWRRSLWSWLKGWKPRS